MKDFYDIWLLIRRFDFDHAELREIIHKVFKNRGTTLEVSPIAFMESFYDSSTKKDKWNAFLRDISQESIPLETVMLDLKNFFKNLIPLESTIKNEEK